MVREDDLEEIAKNIEGNLEEDMKSSTSKEEDIHSSRRGRQPERKLRRR